MVFPPIPVYLDPSNWQQQGPVGNESSQLQPLPPPPPHVSGGPTSSGSIRPGSMADRARLANIPLPEAGLKCPRCESTNTKFCYFNNYSLTQPRHFCKTCRRYWTRGGTMRNVPVGGGSRRNKKSKNGASKPSTNTSDGSRSICSTNTHPSNMITHNFHQYHPTLPFMTSSHNFNQFGVGNLGLNLSGIGIGQTNTGFHVGSNSGLINNAILSTVEGQQMHFFDPQQPPTTGIFPFQHQGGSAPDATPSSSNTKVSDQVTPAKMEESHVLNLSRQQLGVPQNSQYWPGGANNWTELSEK